ncbi:hypothetical protein R4I72_18085 [Leclercia adecarboxylata]|uniref:hypothetical protein n=1 Tax=Leclercia adecarboxylata TaxID=83655 RepID=UPI0027CFE594|nr:hypothetical protein [Leclercia adecarboxylata]MDQ2130637.1 hypothetical protein [Leclercia adecarboxylata]MDV7058945.1 hypothetical protein [Leclercia adecarboxylata]
MGFPSPAADYVSQRMTPELICGVGIDTRILETSSGFALIEPVGRLTQGQVLLILSGGRTQFAKLMGKALICDDDEAIEGEAAEEVEVMGRVTFFINSTDADDIPV